MCNNIIAGRIYTFMCGQNEVIAPVSVHEVLHAFGRSAWDLSLSCESMYSALDTTEAL